MQRRQSLQTEAHPASHAILEEDSGGLIPQRNIILTISIGNVSMCVFDLRTSVWKVNFFLF